MDYRSLVNKLEAIERGVVLEAAMPYGNPYTNPEDRAKFELMTDADQEWLTRPVPDDKGGKRPGAPNINDSIILSRAPNGGKPDPAKVSAKEDEPLLAKLKQLIELVDKYMALKAKKAQGGQGAKPVLTPKADNKPQAPTADNKPQPTGVTVWKEGAISGSLLESFGYANEAQTDEGLGSAAAKVLGKAAPGVGAVLGAQGAVDSWKKGDYLGAALNGLSGAFSLVPGLGWIPAVGLGMWQAGREISGAADAAGKPTPQAGAGANPSRVDPKVQALQKKLLAAGADLGPSGADGIMGPKTQAAMKQFPNIKEGTEMNQPKSLAESIKELQNRLAMIEAEEAAPAEAEAEPASSEENSLGKQLERAGGKLMEKDGRQFMVLPEKGIAVEIPSMEIVDASTPALTPTGKQFNPAELGLSEDLNEGLWDSILKGAAKMATGAKMAGTNFAGGLKGGLGVAAPTGKMLGKTGSAATQAQKIMPGSRAAFATGKALNTAGKAIKANPGKAGLAAGLGGLGLGLASGPGGAGANPTATSSGHAGGGSSGAANVAPTAPEGDDEEMKALRAQIDALIKELSTSQNPAIQKGLADINTKLGS